MFKLLKIKKKEKKKKEYIKVTMNFITKKEKVQIS